MGIIKMNWYLRIPVHDFPWGLIKVWSLTLFKAQINWLGYQQLSSDVLDDYHIRNRKAHRQMLPTQQLSELSEVPDSEEDVEESSESESVPAHKRGKQNSATQCENNDGRPTQLEFYQGTWVEILEHAKKLFHVWLVTKCPWPEHETHLVNAENCLTAAIKKYRKKGSEIEEGRSRINHSLLFWFRHWGYYPKYKGEMSILVSFHICIQNWQ